MPAPETPANRNAPLANLEEWEDFLKVRYPENEAKPAQPFQAIDPNKKKEQFRNYETDARSSVREFYRLNHSQQTYDFVQAKRQDLLALNRRKMGIWEATEYLNTLVDDSDPDTDLLQIIATDRVLRLFADHGDNRQAHRCENDDDADHHHQFHESKTVTLLHDKILRRDLGER